MPAAAADLDGPSTPEPQAIAPASLDSGEAKPPLAAPARKSRRFRRWLPAFALAAIPALIVGLAVYALAGGDSGGGANAGTAGIIDGFLRLGPDDTSNIQSFTKALPSGFPGDFPPYPGSKLVVSFAIRSSQGSNFFAIFTAADSPDRVLAFFQERLAKDPWQVELAQASGDTSAISFSKPADPDVRGSVSAHHSDLDGKTSVFISIEDVSSSARRKVPDKPAFVLQPSLVLPPGFPSEVPIFKGKEASTVTQTYFERGSGSVNYAVSFLTKESQDDVIAFYRGEFQKRGWQVTDSRTVTRFALGIDFQDGAKQEVQGSVRADTFTDDAAFTKVDLLLQVSARRGRGN